MRIRINVDLDGFDRASEDVLDKQVRPAIAAGLNTAAVHIRDDLSAATKTSFDRPRPFTVNAFHFYRAKPRKGQDPDIVLRVKTTQARYLDLMVHGGIRRAGTPGSTRKGPVTPGKGARLNQFGGLPRNFIAQQLAKKDTYWEPELGPRKQLALMRRTKQGLKVLAVIVDQIRVKPQFDFAGIVRKSASKHVPPAVRSELRRRLSP